MVVAILTCFAGVFALSYGLQVIPERASVTYANENYLKNARANVRRYSRRSNYYLNLEGTTLHTWGNNITINFIFYEYLHNEYKRSFIEMHFKICDLLQKEPYVGKAIQEITSKLGIPCPAPPGIYALMNLTIPMDNFPNVWPFEKCKVEVIFQQTPTNDIVAKGEVFASFKQPFGESLPKKKN